MAAITVPHLNANRDTEVFYPESDGKPIADNMKQLRSIIFTTRTALTLPDGAAPRRGTCRSSRPSTGG